ncbi:MAG: [protein-PII] uridylyltransferase [Verrucomicrobiales bacterium]|nr:[protein-PII] uridylyltransferase [Verrucomicrobiales bacterium]
MTDREYQQSLDRTLEKVFGPPPEKPRSKKDLLRLSKQFLKLQEARIRMHHRNASSGVEVCSWRSDMIDRLVRILWDGCAAHLSPESRRAMPLSVCAHGGYGRRVMSPGSDIDLTFLFPGNRTPTDPVVEELVREFLLLLYDLRLKVGHGTRSVGDCIRLANESMETKTALMEIRHLHGRKEAFEELRQRFDPECMTGRETEFLGLRQRDLKQRHRKFGDTPFVQEPHVKNGCGGLRDYQNLIWMSYAKLGSLNPQSLVKNGFISHKGWKEVATAYDFILRVRNEMHYSEKRGEDLLTLRLQGVVATHLGYRHRRILHRIEAFMRDYYTATRDIFDNSREVMDRFHLEVIDTPGLRRRALNFFLPSKRTRPVKFDGFISRNNRLFPENDAIFKEDRFRLIRLFVHTQRRHLRLSPELYDLIQKHLRLVTVSYRYQDKVREPFLSILQRSGDVGRTLRQMHRARFLGRLIPEFGALTCLVQHEFFHQYTADEHTLRTIEILDTLTGEVRSETQFYQKLLRGIDKPWLLYLALLMHDTGRAANRKRHDDESVLLADNVCRRLLIKGEERRRIIFLVDNHLLMYKTATTQNLEDPSVIEEFAGIVRSQENLDNLLVMTYADSNGTSTQSWSGYKEASIRRLYRLTSAFFDAPTDFMDRAGEPVTELREAVLKSLDASWQEEVDAHFTHMPKAYFNFRQDKVITLHLQLFREFFENLVQDPDPTGLLPVFHWQDFPDQGHSELIVVCWDRPQLLARVAGALAAQNISILSADLFRRYDDLVIDIFRVTNSQLTPVSSKGARQRIEEGVRASFLDPHFSFGSAIDALRKPNPDRDAMLAEIPERVSINNTVSQDATVVELQCVDRLGLLYDILKSIGELKLNVSHARINTEKGVAVDVIYVRTAEGTQVTDELVCRQLLAAIGSIAGTGHDVALEFIQV